MRSASRRSLLSSAALAAAGAAVPAVALAGGGAPDPDARLVELGAVFHRHHTWEGLPEPADDREARAYGRRAGAALREIAATPAAGLPGIAVKARCVACEARDGESPHKHVLIDGMLADLDRLAGPVAGASAVPRPHPDAPLLALAGPMEAAKAAEVAVFDAYGALHTTDEQDAECDAATLATDAAAARVVPVPALTLDGLRVKARAYMIAIGEPDLADDPGDVPCERILRSILRDLADGRARA